jgi:hypothetical protein
VSSILILSTTNFPKALFDKAFFFSGSHASAVAACRRQPIQLVAEAPR